MVAIHPKGWNDSAAPREEFQSWKMQVQRQVEESQQNLISLSGYFE